MNKITNQIKKDIIGFLAGTYSIIRSIFIIISSLFSMGITFVREWQERYFQMKAIRHCETTLRTMKSIDQLAKELRVSDEDTNRFNEKVFKIKELSKEIDKSGLTTKDINKLRNLKKII
ncbi:MAG: hypothetical protein CSA45_00900 [Gammaproteobacteria bacterium]|nr:MAG: hypothetical protein CSA45_00900 [Gammaproteobacteria bacterium]